MKKLWKENRIIFVLIIILVICFIAIASVALTFFYSKDANVYGPRVDDIDKHPVTSKFKSNLKEGILENENAKKVDITQSGSGRTIFVSVTFDDESTLENSKKVIENSLKLINKKMLSYFDFEFIIKNKEFTIIGVKNINTENIVWNNNTQIESESETETDEE